MRLSVRFASLALLALGAACAPRTVPETTPAPSTAAAITSPAELIRAMHDRYAGAWYHNLTFVQASTFYRPDGTVSRKETWYEAGQLPGALRIDFGPPVAGNGVLYLGDSSFTFSSGRVVQRSARRNPLMLLGFDVYTQSPARTVSLLREEGFDMTHVHGASANGKMYWVVGAPAGDTTKKQFWVEADRLLFWRMLEPARNQTGVVTETRFQKYVKHGGGWVAEEVDFLRNGKRFYFESYDSVKVNQPLDSALFNPRTFTSARHWRR